jgi:hypothetical protein
MIVLDSLAVGHARVSGGLIYTGDVARRGQRCALEGGQATGALSGKSAYGREGSLSFRHLPIKY